MSRLSFTIRSAGSLWRLEFDDAALAGEAAGWFGPWVVEPGAPDAGCAGIVSMTDAGGGTMPPTGITATDRAIEIHAPGASIEITDGPDARRARARYRRDVALPSAALALRALLVREALARDWLPLHATAVRVDDAVWLFAGPSGAGKTTAAQTFPPAQRLDEDFVILRRAGERDAWARADVFNRDDPRAYAPGEADGLPVRAVLLPRPGDAFSFERLAGQAAVRACFHMPQFACIEGEAGATEAVAAALARLQSLCASTPVARFAWRLGEDLPGLLRDRLGLTDR
jgi:hypothetical protein